MTSAGSIEQIASAVGARYRVEREVGRGGMATVFLAHDQKHHRPVALKVLHAHLSANLGPERFLREIQIAAALQHPHIVPLYDSGQSEGLLYYVMPYIEGESLRHRLERDGRLPLEDALRLTRSVASALEYAHQQHVVHRDIKPENVMLHHGEAMVTDFGIAKAVSAAAAGNENLTQTGTSMGTPAYMSPEQAAGEAELDGRSDIYSLACMLYEMLSGRTPFAGPSAQAMIARRFIEAAPPLRMPRGMVPEWVERAMMKALERDAGRRYSTSGEFAQALGSVGGFTTPPSNVTMPTAVQADRSKSIAVLPFVNMSSDAENEYFTDGIAEEIINALTKVQSLRVAARTSSFAFKGQNRDVRTIGEELGVSTVLEGSVRKSGKRLRLTAQLVNVVDGYHLWSDRFDREMEDVFAIQDEISGSIVKALQVVLSEGEKRAIENAPRTDVEAYDYYLRGRQFFHQFRRTGIQFARRMYERALEMDPNYVLAYAGAADCCSFLYMYWDASKSNLDQADGYSRKALEVGPEVAEAHASRGLAMTLSKQYDEARREFETAIRLNPKLFEAHYFFGRVMHQQGRYEEAFRHFEDAAAIRPEDYQTPILATMPLQQLGRHEEAERWMERALAVMEQHLNLNPDDARALTLGANALAQRGQRARAIEWLNRAVAIDPEDSGMLYNVACGYAAANEPDRAFGALEKAVQNGFGHREWIENDPDFEPIRQDPRFEALLKKL